MEAVEKPKGAVPKFGLPRWKVMPLDSKIPLIPCPENVSNFSCKKIARPIFTTTKKAQFNLNDPNNNEIKFPYNSLHDKHLKCYFENKNNIKYMIKRGFVTKNLDVKCTVKEYNVYRKYLNKLHGDMVVKELKRRDEINADRRVLEIAEREAQKEAEK